MNAEGRELIELLDNQPILFGLEAQGKIPTIEAMIANGRNWTEIGEAIGWHGPTAKEHYERYLKRKAKP